MTTAGDDNASEGEHDLVPQADEAQTSKIRQRARKAPLRFDARGLLACFEDFVWATDIQLDRIAIGKMGAKKIFDEQGKVVDEAYEEVATKALP